MNDQQHQMVLNYQSIEPKWANAKCLWLFTINLRSIYFLKSFTFHMVLDILNDLILIYLHHYQLFYFFWNFRHFTHFTDLLNSRANYADLATHLPNYHHFTNLNKDWEVPYSQFHWSNLKDFPYHYRHYCDWYHFQAIHHQKYKWILQFKPCSYMIGTIIFYAYFISF